MTLGQMGSFSTSGNNDKILMAVLHHNIALLLKGTREF